MILVKIGNLGSLFLFEIIHLVEYIYYMSKKSEKLRNNYEYKKILFRK